MTWQYHPVLVLFAFGGLVSLGVAGYCWDYVRRHGRSTLVVAIGALGLGNAVWVFAATLKTSSADLALSLLFYKLEVLGLLSNTVAAIVLALAYVGQDRWLGRRRVALLGLAPAAFVVLAWLNPGQVMIVAPELIPAQGILAFEHEFPPLFSVYLAWVYGTALVAVAILVWGAVTDRAPTRPALVGALALLCPLATGLAKTAGIYPSGGDGINVAPAAGAIGISVFAFAIVRYQLFEPVPVGRARAVEEMREGYLLVGPDGTVLDANPAAAELLAEVDGSGPHDRPATEVLPSFDDLAGTCPVDLRLQDRTVEVRCSSVTRQDQDAGDVLLFHDVTEERRRQRELERTNERLDRFASRVSHDLRNPLNVAQGRLELARETPTGQDEHLAVVADAHDRMEALIEDLLVLAREGDSVERTEPVDLAALAETAWRTVETADARLVTDTATTIAADPGRLQRLFENLFRNAIEHAGGDVTVTVGTVEDGFYVGDDGPGIPGADRDAVFDAGYSTASENTGFGLNIVREIAEAHRWTVRVTDGEAGGARFEVTGVETVD